MLFNLLQPVLNAGSLQIVAIAAGVFFVILLVVLRGVSWVFSKHRTSRAETTRLLNSLRGATIKRFLLATVLTAGLEVTLRYWWGAPFDEPRLAGAAYIGILLTSLSDLFLASSIVLLLSVFTRPISQILGGVLDLLQSVVLAFVTGWLVRNLADLEFFRSIVWNIPIAMVLCVASLVYAVSGTALWVFEERARKQ